MILVLAGTQDGRELANGLSHQGFMVMVSVVSDYGRQLAQNEHVLVNASPLAVDGLLDLIQKENIELIVDASHPYAVNVSRNAIESAWRAGIKYVRYERKSSELPVYQHLHSVNDYQQAAQVAATLGKTIFLTTGSRHLNVFKDEVLLQEHRLIARVLPEPGVLSECIALGFKPKDIIAMQGPFSHELNVALFRECGAEVVVTKNSGKIGGSDTKFTAAIELHLPLVVIDRPQINYGTVAYSMDEIIQFI